MPAPVWYPDEALYSEFLLKTFPSVVNPVKLPTFFTEVRASLTNLLNKRLYLFFSLLSMIDYYFLESMGLYRTTEWLYPVNISCVSSEYISSTSSISSTLGKKSSSICSITREIMLSLGVRLWWPFLTISCFCILTKSRTVLKLINVFTSWATDVAVAVVLCLLSFRSNRASLSDLKTGWWLSNNDGDYWWHWLAAEYVW